MSEDRELRRVFGHFATGVSVVTAMSGGEPSGLTVNSLASLSLEPPQLIVCLKRGNRSYAAFRDARTFAVNVLSEDQAGLSRLFASTLARKFDGVEHTFGRASGAPLIAGAHAWLECEVAAVFDPPGTHAIVVGRLLHFALGDAERPLLFHAGTYRALGPVI